MTPQHSHWLDGTSAALRPPPRLSLSQWADQHYRLSAENSAEPGRWRTRAYQRGIMDAITDPSVERVSVMKSARVGYTLCIGAAIGYHMHHDPCGIMVVQPTVETAKKYSKEFIAPTIRDVPELAALVQGGTKSSSKTILDKSFPGGVLSMVGANSGAGFRMSSRRVVIFDEVDGYPASAGDEGDPIALGEARAREFWNRKIIAGSTPTNAGSSRIEELFEAGDRRRFFVPCPQCGHMDVLRFRKRRDDEPEGGHRMRWPEGRPQDASFECGKNGCAIEERHKRAMLAAGEWRAEREFTGHASFHIWAAYSLGANATWGQIATEFVEASKGGVEKLKAVINTLLGETWQDRGEAPEWEQLFRRRATYQIGTVPDGVIVLTAGVDVQKDRLVYEVVGWGADRQSHSIEIGELHGDTSLEAPDPVSPWTALDALIDRTFPGANGSSSPIAMTAIDSGYNTQIVYGYTRDRGMSRVMACKGVTGPRMLIGTAVPVDVTIRGRRIQRGHRMWPIGVDIAKAELYGWLRLELKGGDPPPGYCHFPEYDEEYFRQLTSEQRVATKNRKTGRVTLAWHVLPNRENHYLDARILARAAAAVLGIDRMARTAATTAATTAQPATPAEQPQTPAPAPPPSSEGGIVRARGLRPRTGWLSRRR